MGRYIGTIGLRTGHVVFADAWNGLAVPIGLDHGCAHATAGANIGTDTPKRNADPIQLMAGLLKLLASVCWQTMANIRSLVEQRFSFKTFSMNGENGPTPGSS